MADGGKITAIIDLDASGVKKGSKEAREAVEQIDSSLKGMESGFKSVEKAGKLMTTAITLPIVGFGALSINTAKDFEYAMSQVQAISGATGDDLKALEDQARELGRTTFYSASEASEGMKYYAMAGYEVNEIMDAMPASINLAIASSTDLGIVCDIVSDAMTALGMSTEETTHFTDILAKTATSTNTTVEGLGESFKYSSAIAGTLGIKAEDLAVALGTMANAGIKGTMAGNQLKTGLLRLSEPTKEMKDTMEKYNIALQTNEDGSVNLMDTMIHLREKLSGLDQVTQASVLSQLMGKEATAGWASIVSASQEEFEQLTEGIYNCSGSAKEMADIMGDNLQGRINSLKSSFEGVQIAIGDKLIPIFEKVVQGATNVCDWFTNLDGNTQTLIIGFAGFVAVLGPLLTIAPKLVIGFKTMSGVLVALKGGLGLTAGATAGLTVALSAGAVALAGFMAWIGSSSEAITALQDNFGTFGVVVGGVCEFLYGTFQLTFGNIGILISTLGKMLMALMKGDFKEVGNIWKDGWAEMEVNTAKAGSNMAGHTTNAIKKMREMSGEELSKLEGHFNDTMGTLKTVTADNIDEATSVFVEQLKGMDNDTIATLKGTSDSMAMLFDGISANMTDTQATNVFKDNLEAMVRSGELNLSQLEADTEEFSKIVANNISTGANQVENAGKELWTNFKNVSTRGIAEVSSNMASDISKMNQETFTALQASGDTWSQAFSGITDVASMSTSEIAKIVETNFTNMGLSGAQIAELLEKELTDAFKTTEVNAETSMAGVEQAVTNATTNASANATANMTQVEQAVTNATTNANTTATANMSGVESAVTNATSTASSNASTNMSGVKEAITSNTNVAGEVSANMAGVNNAISSGTANATKTAETNTKGMSNAIDKNTKNLSKTADTNFKAIDRSAKTHFTTATNNVKKDATSMYNGAKTSFSKLASEATKSITTLKENVINQTAIMKNSAIKNWEAIKDAYSKSITGTVTIKKKEESASVNLKKDEGTSIYSAISLDTAEMMARHEALASLSNIRAGDTIGLNRADIKATIEKERATTKESNNITYNYTYTSPKESSISELRRKDRVQAQRLALSF